MANKKIIIDEIAMNFINETNVTHLDVPYSNDYVIVNLPVGKRYAFQVENHNITNSESLKALFNAHYRNSNHKEVVPYFNMMGEMFENDKFAPAELDFGTIELHYGNKITDIISGVSGNFGNHGWVISNRLFEIFKQFNIGKYQQYNIVVKSRGVVSNDHVYLHFINYADDFIDYSKSKFYMHKRLPPGDFSYMGKPKTEVSFASHEELELVKAKMNEGLDLFDVGWTTIYPLQIFLKNNNLDLFKFNKLLDIETYMSAALVAKIAEENITGLELKRTMRVKDLE